RHGAGRPLATARRYALDGRTRAAHRRDRDNAGGGDRYLGGLSRRAVRRRALAGGPRLPGLAPPAPAGRGPPLPAALGRAAHGDRGEHAGLAVGGTSHPSTDAFTARA